MEPNENKLHQVQQNQQHMLHPKQKTINLNIKFKNKHLSKIFKNYEKNL